MPNQTDNKTDNSAGSSTILRGEGLTKEFGKLIALDEVDLHLRENEILSLIGPNGAGKTTLFNCISGVYEPTQGRVSLFGENATGLPAHVLAKRGLTRTFQIARPLEDLTVLENVMVGSHIDTRNRDEAQQIAREQLSFVGLADRMELEAGELTIADQKMMELARVLATDPQILLTDEIMAGLTPTETQEMLDLFRQVRDIGKSIIIIEHDMQAVMDVSDRVMVLNNGEKIADDEPKVVANDETVIESYLGGTYA